MCCQSLNLSACLSLKRVSLLSHSFARFQEVRIVVRHFAGFLPGICIFHCVRGEMVHIVVRGLFEGRSPGLNEAAPLELLPNNFEPSRNVGAARASSRGLKFGGNL